MKWIDHAGMPNPIWAQKNKYVSAGMRRFPNLSALVETWSEHPMAPVTNIAASWLNEGAFQAPPGENLNNLRQGLAQIAAVYRMEASGNQLFEVTRPLIDALENTSIGAKTPIGALRLPYDYFYLHFDWGVNGLPEAYTLGDSTIIRELGGAYIGRVCLRYREEEHSPIFDRLGLSPNTLNTGIEITTVWSLPGTREGWGARNDLLLSSMLLSGKQDMSIEEVAECLPALNPGINRAAVEMISKILLYLNADDVEQRRICELTDLQGRIERVQPRKRSKLQRRAQHAYDRTLLGPAQALGGFSTKDLDAHAAGEKRPHWRRGHFRNTPYKEGYRVRWIKPTLVRGDRLKAAFEKPSKPRKYKLR